MNVYNERQRSNANEPRILTNPSSSSRSYQHIQIGGDARAHLGDNHYHGASEDRQILDAVLASLYYPEMGGRSGDVPDAGTDTFDWIFEDGGALNITNDKSRDLCNDIDERDALSSNFLLGEYNDIDAFRYLSRSEDYWSWVLERRKLHTARIQDWLSSNNDKILWITGKPGSGKSTFMKFLRDHEMTDGLLHEWANGEKLIVADHFFWLPGTPLQSSIEGLLRSLLHDVLSQLGADLPLAKAICQKKRWNLATSQRPWSIRELRKMMTDSGVISGVRILYLIDGLDECCPQHLHAELIDLLLGCIQSPASKLCVSSRPWNDFSNRLGNELKLELHQLTQLDMLTYARSKLVGAASDQLPNEFLQAEINGIIRSLVSRADGVFLWLELVLRAMVVEIKKCRGVHRLRSIMHEHPSNLDEYFAKLIYNRIPVTRNNVSDTASALKLAMMIHQAGDSAPANINSSFLPFWLLSCDALHTTVAYPSSDATDLDEDDIAIMLKQTKGFLSQSCNDLLLLSDKPNNPSVRFLHRTVFDFLNNFSENHRIHQMSPRHFDDDGFLESLSACCSSYELLRSNTDCDTINRTLKHAILMQNSVPTEWRAQYMDTCENFAIRHLSRFDECDGKHRRSSIIPKALSLPIPYKFWRATLLHWPHLAISDGLLLYNLPGARPNASVDGCECDYLCQACTQLLYESLRCGVVISKWLPLVGQHRTQYEGSDQLGSGHGRPLHEPQNLQASVNKLVESKVVRKRRGSASTYQDEHPCSDCELCEMASVSPAGRKIKAGFFAGAQAPYSAHTTNGDTQSTSLRASQTGVSRMGKTLLSSMSYIPESLLDTAEMTVTYTSPMFQAFVWRRQKLRAAKSLFSTVHKQLGGAWWFSEAGIGEKPALKAALISRMIDGWARFLLGFAPTLVDFLDSASNRTGDYVRVDVSICLTCDGFPRTCERCFERPDSCEISAHEDGATHRSFTIAFQIQSSSQNDIPWMRKRNVAPAIIKILEWYIANAADYGFAHTIPSYARAVLDSLEDFSRCFWDVNSTDGRMYGWLARYFRVYTS